MASSKKRDYYVVLGVSPKATGSEIKKAFRSRALKCHPDKHPDESDEQETGKENFQELQEAYECLFNTLKRSEYDKARETAPPPEDEYIKRARAEMQQANDYHHGDRGRYSGGQQHLDCYIVDARPSWDPFQPPPPPSSISYVGQRIDIVDGMHRFDGMQPAPPPPPPPHAMGMPPPQKVRQKDSTSKKSTGGKKKKEKEKEKEEEKRHKSSSRTWR